MISIGLLGCGNVGHILARHAEKFKIVAVHDRLPGRAREIADICGAAVCRSIDELLMEPSDLVVEAASVEAVRMHSEKILRAGRDLVILSVGALADRRFHDQIVDVARECGRKIYIPSGAIAGLDNLKIGQIARIDRLLLRTTKPPASLGISSEGRQMVFKGAAQDCIRIYPRNINVAVALGLAAGRDAEVELWVDPAIDRNVHEVFAEGEFGEIYIRVRNVPSPDNPATSYMAALSIISLLGNLDNPLRVGT
ncbi:MAG: aspartate dehydrogenase [Methanoculleaceae archaeon]